MLAPSTDTTPPVAAILTIDNITGINDVADVVATEWTPSGMTPTYVQRVSFTVPTDQTTILNVGRRLKLTETGSSRYGTIFRRLYLADDRHGPIRLGLVDLGLHRQQFLVQHRQRCKY